MLRTLLISIAMVAVALGAAPALACEGMPDCQCNHDKDHSKDAKAKDAAKDKKKAAKADEKKPAAPAQEKAAPVKEGSLLDDLDRLMAAKCDCTGPADCTCKKGQCKCSKCNGRHQRVFESLKGKPDYLRVPQNARGDATAGIFI